MAKVSVIATLKAKPEKADELAAAFEDVFVHIDANESGTEHYVLHRSTIDPNVFVVTEIYTDQAAFDAHATSDAMAALGPLFGEWLESFDLQVAVPVKAAKGLDIG
jgi:quinol monooxygenase YgiN